MDRFVAIFNNRGQDSQEFIFDTKEEAEKKAVELAIENSSFFRDMVNTLPACKKVGYFHILEYNMAQSHMACYDYGSDEGMSFYVRPD